jgi:DNA-binding FadR family transcriptional regulator
MTTALSPEERGTYARQLAGNPIWDELFSNLRVEAVQGWAQTKFEDVESREYFFKHFQILELIKRRIEGYIANAAMNEHIEMQRQKMSQPLKRDDK